MFGHYSVIMLFAVAFRIQQSTACVEPKILACASSPASVHKPARYRFQVCRAEQSTTFALFAYFTQVPDALRALPQITKAVSVHL